MVDKIKRHTITLVTQYYSKHHNYVNNFVINTTISNRTVICVVAVVVTVVVTVVVSVIVVTVVVSVIVVTVVVVGLVADVSLHSVLSSLIPQSSSVSVLVFLPSQITSSSHSPVYHMLQYCHLPPLSLPPGSYNSSQLPPTSPPLHDLIEPATSVHVHTLTCAGLYTAVGMLLEHGHHCYYHTTHAGSVVTGGGGMRGAVVRLISLICNSI